MKFQSAIRSLCAAVLVIGAGCGTGKPPVPDDLPKFQGDWTVVEFAEHGKTADTKRLATLSVSINGMQFNHVEAQGQKLLNADFTNIRLNPEKEPREIEFVGSRGAEQGKTRLGVYAFEGEQLKLAVADFAAPRPTGFASGSKVTTYVLKRKLPDPAPAAPAK